MNSSPDSRKPSINKPDRLIIKSTTVQFREFELRSSDDESSTEDCTCHLMISKSNQQHDHFKWSNPFASGPDVYNFQSTRRPSVPNFKRRMSSFSKSASTTPSTRSRAPSLARRPSEAIVNAFEKIDPLAIKGNPLGLEMNEIARLPTINYTSSRGFDSRRPSMSYSKRMSTSERSFSKPLPALTKQSFIYVRNEGKKDDSYAIQRLPTSDDFEDLSTFRKATYRLGPLFMGSSLGLHLTYLVVRARFTWQASKIDPYVSWPAWTFLVAELFMVIPLWLQILWSWNTVGTKKRPKLRLIGDSAPSVDLIITCNGEDDDVVLDTAKAACNMRYPLERFRVIVCDDGRSRSLAQTVIGLVDAGFDNLYYRSRAKFDDICSNSISENLNYALEETNRLPGGVADFFAVLDANMVPHRDWLRALLPHMLQDKNCSMAYSPQSFYNIPVDDPLCQRMDHLTYISESINDSLGVAWCIRSGYILRRSAIESVGGFPSAPASDGACASHILLGSGWSTAFVQEALQWGTVPDSLEGHIDQRTRAIAAMVIASIKFRFGLCGRLVTHMDYVQRIWGFFYTLGTLFPIFTFLSILMIPIALAGGGFLIPYSNRNQLRWLIRLCFFYISFSKLAELTTYLPPDHESLGNNIKAMIWMAPYHTASIIRAVLFPKTFPVHCAKTCPRGSLCSEMFLPYHRTRFNFPLVQRLKMALWDSKVIFHLLYIFFVIFATTSSVFSCLVFTRTMPTQIRIEHILTHAGWPPMIWLACILSCWKPLSYTLFPPAALDRQDLLSRDPKTGVAYPTDEAKAKKTTWWSLVDEIPQLALLLYTTVLFVLSFIF